MSVVNVDGLALGHMLREQWHEPSAANMRDRRKASKLADRQPGEDGFRLRVEIVRAQRRRDLAVLDLVADQELPRRLLAGVRAPVSGAAMRVEIGDALRYAVALDVIRRAQTIS